MFNARGVGWGRGWGAGGGVGGSYFAWLWLARAADFTMDGLISVEGLVLSDHGKAFCHTGMKGFVYPDCSSDTLSEENLRLQYTVLHKIDPVQTQSIF